jgi:hypothetical protein
MEQKKCAKEPSLERVESLLTSRKTPRGTIDKWPFRHRNGTFGDYIQKSGIGEFPPQMLFSNGLKSLKKAFFIYLIFFSLLL